MSDINEALRESEERYRTLFEQAPVGLFVFDRSLTIRDCNEKLSAMLVTPRERIIGLELRSLRDRSILPAMAQVFEGKTTSYEGPYETTHSHLQLVVAMHVAPLRDAAGKVAFGMAIVEDITERMRAVAALRASEQRLALHVKKNPLGVVVWNTRFEVMEWNDAATRIFGFTEAEAIGKRATELIVPPHARPYVDDVWRRLGTRSGGDRGTNENVTKDGRVILCEWYNTPIVDADGNLVAVASIVEDVTTRKTAEGALKRSEARFRSLIEHAPDAISVVRDGRYVYVNPAFVSYLGYPSPLALLGMRVQERVVAEEDVATLERATLGPPQELRMQRADGSMVTCEVVSIPIDYDGQPAVLAMTRDVTERKLMQARLLQSDRMASVGTLAAGVAHEINNPLAYVKANLDVVALRHIPELLRRVRALEEERAAVADHTDAREPDAFELSASLEQIATMIGLAREGSERVRTIVRDLKTFSRADDETRSVVDVERVLDASVNMAWTEIRHRARLVRDYGQLPPVVANESRLGQVFLNLLVNAAQAIPEGHAAEHEIRLKTTTDAQERVVVSVSDTGSGIPPEAMDRIFDPFFTTKPVGVGTGLGLWICQGIVTALGGEIHVESATSHGTTVTVSLPSRYTDAATTASPRATAAASRRGRILLIDDEPALGPSLAIALSDEHDVVSATSGRQALDLLKSDDRFDLVLCDLMMPDVTGMDVYEQLRAERPAVADRMVFVTGGSFTRRSSEFLESITNRSLEKPFDLQRVRDLVRERLS